jgi:hypothetical protein
MTACPIASVTPETAMTSAAAELLVEQSRACGAARLK